MSAKRHLTRRPAQRHVTRLLEEDVEHRFWHWGYAPVFRRSAHMRSYGTRAERIGEVIRKALKATGKPMMALHVLEAVLATDSPGVPGQLGHAIEQAVELARNCGKAREGQPRRRTGRSRPS